jgi:uncharacterized membrane protein YhaH (DUF805 family)
MKIELNTSTKFWISWIIAGIAMVYVMIYTQEMDCNLYNNDISSMKVRGFIHCEANVGIPLGTLIFLILLWPVSFLIAFSSCVDIVAFYLAPYILQLETLLRHQIKLK